MEQRINLVTLGVEDLAAARRFFEDGLGWRPAAFEGGDIAFYDTGTCGLGLWSADSLAEDAGVAPEPGAYAACSIAWNGRSEAEVDEVFARAVEAGADALKAPVRVFWGGYSGYVRIPGSRHLLELAYNPVFPLAEDGRMVLPPPAA